MAIAVVTKASGGLPVIDVTATKPGLGVPVTEATHGRGIAVTKVSLAVGGLPVTFVADSNYWPPSGGGTTYATWDAATVTAVTLSGGNLVATNTGTTSANQGARVATTSGKASGKHYCEITLTTVIASAGDNHSIALGTTGSSYSNLTNFSSDGVVVDSPTGTARSQNAYLGWNLGTLVQGDVICIAADLDNRRVWFRKGASGNWNGSGANNPATNTGGQLIPSSGTVVPFAVFGGTNGVAGQVCTANFGASAFSGAVPSGFTSGWPV
jgi:hypothetical protein